MFSNRSSRCYYCLEKLTGFYILCAECSVIKICVKCFSCGVEGGKHKKIHKYIIKGFEDGCHIITTENTWLPEEELKLLEALETYGYGNWDEISAQLQPHSSVDCRDHYGNFYMSGAMKELINSLVCSIPCITEHIYPCRQSDYVDEVHSVCDLRPDYQRSLGYLPCRDEFEFEYMNSAEEVVSSISFLPNRDELDEAMQLALMGIYNRYIEERYFRHRVARSHNLITRVMHDLMYNQSKQKSRNFIFKNGSVSRGSYRNHRSRGVSRIKRCNRKFCFKTRFSRSETEYSYKLETGVDHINNTNVDHKPVITEQLDNKVFVQSPVLTPKHLNYSWESLQAPHLKNSHISHSNLQEDKKEIFTADSDISGMNKTLDSACVLKTSFIHNGSWLMGSSTTSEIVDSGISSAESSANSTTSCGSLSDRFIMDVNKATFDSTITVHKVTTRPRSHSDSVWDSSTSRLKINYPVWDEQTLLSNRLTNPEIQEAGHISNTVKGFTQPACEVEAPSHVPAKRRRGRPPKNSHPTSYNQRIERPNHQIVLDIPKSEDHNVDCCNQTLSNISPEKRISQSDILSNPEINNSLKSLTWLTEAVETPSSIPVHRRRGRPPLNRRLKSSAAYTRHSTKTYGKTFLTHPQWLKPFFRYLSTSEAEVFLRNLERERILRIELSELIEKSQEYHKFSTMQTEVSITPKPEDSSEQLNQSNNSSSSSPSTSPSTTFNELQTFGYLSSTITIP
ncbi:unnamed protein product [Heterobilharzia americana]|nr:unnamed protein product [Heterobilharzia americana]